MDHPDDPLVRRALGQAFATRAGATPARLAATLVRRDGAGAPVLPSADSLLADVRSFLPYRDATDNAYRMKDLRRALSLRVADAAAAAALPRAEQAEVGIIAGALVGRCVLQLVDGARIEAMTHDQIGAVVDAGFDQVADTLPGAYLIFKATRAAVADAAVPGLSWVPYAEAEVPAALDTPAQLTERLQRLAGRVAEEEAARSAARAGLP